MFAIVSFSIYSTQLQFVLIFEMNLDFILLTLNFKRCDLALYIPYFE